MKGSVVQEWLGEKCTWKQQTVLLTALRGCDGISKEDVSKDLVRLMRGIILQNADKKSTFIRENRTSAMAFTTYDCLVKGLFDNVDKYSLHWLLHFLHAAEIIGYKHPDEMTRRFWRGFYYVGCDNFHMQPETETRMDERLKDGDCE